ncbi:hypothetical protein Q1J61_08660 [Pseudomonas putida]|uniref:hypothetical protein n=1 Tax=Pseudomonas putida TaxID=303 RepID=UPI0034D3DE6F
MVLPLAHILQHLEQQPALGLGEIAACDGLEGLDGSAHAALAAWGVVLFAAVGLHINGGLQEVG